MIWAGTAHARQKFGEEASKAEPVASAVGPPPEEPAAAGGGPQEGQAEEGRERGESLGHVDLRRFHPVTHIWRAADDPGEIPAILFPTSIHLNISQTY